MSELGRRLVHASGAGFPALYLLSLVDWQTLRLLLLGFAGVAVLLELLRLSVGLDWAIYDRLTREYERDNPAGYALYAVSMALVGVAFSPPVATPGMLMLALADPVSGVLGSADVGEWKSPPVLFATFGLSFCLAAPLTVPARGVAVGSLAAAAGAAGAAVADGYKPQVAGFVVDDNASIPTLASAGIALVFALA
ncbi:MAG: dolichol kinase [Haloferacaceae archaeon]